MGLRPVPDRDPDTGARADHRQGIPTADLLAQVLVAKYADHFPLYRQEGTFQFKGYVYKRQRLQLQWASALAVASAASAFGWHGVLSHLQFL